MKLRDRASACIEGDQVISERPSLVDLVYYLPKSS